MHGPYFGKWETEITLEFNFITMSAKLKNITPIFLENKSPLVEDVAVPHYENVDRIYLMVIDKEKLRQLGHASWNIKGRERISFISFTVLFLVKRGYM